VAILVVVAGWIADTATPRAQDRAVAGGHHRTLLYLGHTLRPRWPPSLPYDAS
jgi:hypothetical protein